MIPSLRLNIGAGKQTWDGWFCVDAVQHPKSTRPLDLLYEFEFDGPELKHQIPLPDGVADQLFNGHFIEHVYRWQAPAVIKEFHRLLMPGGVLVMELPNILLAAKHLLKGAKDQMCMWPLYGDWSHNDPYMMHKHGYTPQTIEALLVECGFRNIQHKPPQTHGRRVNRDMRIEAVK